ncbi:MAG: lecithin retinol acyltransferase family protein [Deltaproteobacteria bacterium]|nr:lecithin retinol acyltransferase family protein [Deltaproteobacteria bacterium]
MSEISHHGIYTGDGTVIHYSWEEKQTGAHSCWGVNRCHISCRRQHVNLYITLLHSAVNP